jgi:predicted dehydrogenase
VFEIGYVSKLKDDHSTRDAHYHVASWRDGGWRIETVAPAGRKFGYIHAGLYVGGVAFPDRAAAGQVYLTREQDGLWHFELWRREAAGTWRGTALVEPGPTRHTRPRAISPPAPQLGVVALALERYADDSYYGSLSHLVGAPLPPGLRTVSEQIGLGIVGCGWAASEIVRVGGRLPALRIVTAFDRDTERAAALARQAGAEVAASLEAVLAHPGVTTVYVGVPHALHAPIVAQALEAGKHVLAEKPLALDPAEARRLGTLAADRQLKLAVFFELRRAATVSAAKRLLDDGEIGAPRFIRLNTVIDKRADYWGPPGAPNWRANKSLAGGGVVLMNTIHQLDTVRYLTGLDYVAAQGEIATLTAQAEVEDTASATLTLSNGAILSLAAAAHSPGANHEETIEIDGAAGRLDLPDPFGVGAVRLYRRDSQVWNDIPVVTADSHALMLRSFVDAILGDGAVPASAFDAAAALAAVNAIYRSAAEGRRIEIG